MKKLAIALVAACMASGLAVAGESVTPAALTAGVTDASPQRIVLLVDEIKQIRNFPVVLAERLGYLSDGKTIVTVMNTRDDVPSVDLLKDGRVDAVMAYYHHNVVNQSQGIDTEAVVTLGVTPGAKVYVANQVRDKYRGVTDLKGARIISGGAGSSKTTIANAIVLAGGYGIGDYTRLPTKYAKNVDTLRSGGADLVVAPIPDGDLYESQGVGTVFADLTNPQSTKKALGTLFPSSTVYMMSTRVQAHPEIAQHLADTFVRTLHYINTHTPEQIMAVIPPEIVGKDRAAYLKVLKEEIPMFANDGRMSDEGATKEWQVLTAANPSYQGVKVDQTYTNTFVDNALKALH
jgi:NitT/TauT family transport system substrate-binding protein